MALSPTSGSEDTNSLMPEPTRPVPPVTRMTFFEVGASLVSDIFALIYTRVGRVSGELFCHGWMPKTHFPHGATDN